MQGFHYIIDILTFTTDWGPRRGRVKGPAESQQEKVRWAIRPLGQEQLLGFWIYNRSTGEKQVTTFTYFLLTSNILFKNEYFRSSCLWLSGNESDEDVDLIPGLAQWVKGFPIAVAGE